MGLPSRKNFSWTKWGSGRRKDLSLRVQSRLRSPVENGWAIADILITASFDNLGQASSLSEIYSRKFATLEISYWRR